MRTNRFRELLDAGRPTLGTHLLSTWPTRIELVGQTGIYDYASARTARTQAVASSTVRTSANSVKPFCLGWDVGILHDWRQANGKAMRDRPGTEETKR